MSKQDASEREEKERQRVTRRGFLKGAGLTAAGAAILESGLIGASEAASGAPAPTVIGPERVSVMLRINGANQRLEIEPRTTLAEALRFDLGLTGTKVVCDRGSCSACTVWLDATPVCSCMTLALDATGRSAAFRKRLQATDFRDNRAACHPLHSIRRRVMDEALKTGEADEIMKTSSERETPVVCQFLRTKTAFGTFAGSLYSWQTGNSTTAVYWCLRTMETAGPDDSYAHPHACCDGRDCFERPDED